MTAPVHDPDTGRFVALDGVTITINDIRDAGHCVRGARDWFQMHDLDFRDFLRDGIDAQTFVNTGDALASMVVEAKLERERRG